VDSAGRAGRRLIRHEARRRVPGAIVAIVAIKIIRADLARDQSFQTRFRREVQSIAFRNAGTGKIR
jgi:hypothetical protein